MFVVFVLCVGVVTVHVDLLLIGVVDSSESRSGGAGDGVKFECGNTSNFVL